MKDLAASSIRRSCVPPVRKLASRSVLLVGLVCGPAFPCLSQFTNATAPQSGAYSQAADPLQQLNAAFRAAYARSRQQALPQSTPVIIHSGDTMSFIRQGVLTNCPTITPRYHELKAVAHVPLALFVMLRGDTDSKLAAPAIAGLKTHRELVVAARDSLLPRGFTGNQGERQTRILNRSLDLIDAIVREGAITGAKLQQFAQSQREDVLANAYDAAEDQINTMDRQVQAWLATLSPEERPRLRVAVSSVHMARVGNLAMQYFARTLGEPYEGRFEEEEIRDSSFRLIFTESVFADAEVLNALGTHALDEVIGESFFGDGQRMHRDLLADAAEEILRRKFGGSPANRR